MTNGALCRRGPPNVVLLTATWLAICSATAQSGPVAGKTLSSEKIAQLLREPNGLEAAANLVGRFEINTQGHLWSYMNLDALVSSSTLIVEAKITSRKPRLVGDGDDINTDYTADPGQVLLGKFPGKVDFTVHGGLIEFPNGTSAQITTVEWQQLQVGQRYLLFLRKEKDGLYYPANGVEALFKLSTADGKVDAAASHSRGPHTISGQVKNVPIGSFIMRVQAVIAAKASGSAK